MIIPPPPSKLECALAYAGQGFFVFPLHTPIDGVCSCPKKGDCPDPGKHPRTRNGVKDATNNERMIRSWWNHNPDSNIAIATGSQYRLFVLDVDGDEGRDSLAEIERKRGSLPQTVSSTTGKGEHHFFKCNEPIKNRIRFAPGLDIRGDGGMIVAPGSIHANGRRYEWIIPPDEIPLAAAPEWLLDMIRDPVSKPASSLEGIQKGERNSKLFKRACSLRGKGFGEIEILNRLREVPCDPPLSDEELKKIANSAGKYEPSKIIPLPVNTPTPRITLSWAKMPLRALYDPRMYDSKNYLVVLGIISSRVIKTLGYATIHQQTVTDLINVNRPEKPVSLRTINRVIGKLSKYGYIRIRHRKEKTTNGYLNQTFYEVIYEPEKTVEYDTPVVGGIRHPR